MKTETEKKKISSLLALKTAPKGKIEGDFRVALYAVAALYQLDFGKTSNFGINYLYIIRTCINSAIANSD